MIEYLTITLSIFLTTVCITFIIRRIREERYLTKLEDYENTNGDVLVSVIIPARNEAKTISKSIEGVLSQEGVKKEIIVVDDASEDETSTIVIQNYLGRGVKLVRVSNPEEGWMGKSWAGHHGYLESSGSWLLFIDADVSFNDNYVVRDTIAYATRNGIDASSLIPTLEAEAFSSKIMLPTLLALKYVLTPPRRTIDPNDRLAFFYGSFMLFKRRVYESIGGHRAIRTHILEDKSLGELTKSMGFRVALLDGRGRLRARFNDSFKGYVNGLLRLFTEYAFDSGVMRLWRYLLAALVFMIMPLMLAFYSLFISTSIIASMFSIVPLLLIFLIQAYELRRMKVSVYYFPLVVLSVSIIVSVLFYVALKYRWGGVKLRWRGRTYRYGGGTEIKSDAAMNLE